MVTVPEYGRQMAVALVYGAGIGCDLHHVSSRTRLDRFLKPGLFRNGLKICETQNNIPYDAHLCFRAGDRSFGPDFGRILVGREKQRKRDRLREHKRERERERDCFYIYIYIFIYIYIKRRERRRERDREAHRETVRER